MTTSDSGKKFALNSVHFHKLQGAGNDFVVLDLLQNSLPESFDFVQADKPFMTRWSVNAWNTRRDVPARETEALGIYFCDVPAPKAGQTMVFTLFYPKLGQWEGKDFEIVGR